jgi:hypothetical protein
MAVAQALQATSTALRRNPVVVGTVLVLSLLQLPVQFASLAGPTAATAVGAAFSLVALVTLPFVFGGLLGMAAEALDGTTDLGTFVAAGKRHYTSMLGAYLLLIGVVIVLWFLTSLASIAAVAGIGILSGGLSGSAGLLPIAILLVGVIVSVLGMLVPLLFVQFYGQAIVLDGASAVGGFRRSIGLVRTNLVSVLGYSLLVFGASLLFGLLGSVPSALLSARVSGALISLPLPDLALPAAMGLTVVANVVFGLLGGLFLVFSVAFYRTLDSTGSSEAPSSTQGAVA